MSARESIYVRAARTGRLASREIEPRVQLRCSCCRALAVVHVARPDGCSVFLCDSHRNTPIDDALAAEAVYHGMPGGVHPAHRRQS